MNNIDSLVEIVQNQIVVSSRQLAEHFEKRHDNVLRDIQNLKKDVLNFEEMYFEGSQPDSYGRMQNVYYMNRDGFSLLAMGFTGKKALDWKIKYILAFKTMEKMLLKQSQESYQIADPIERAKRWIEEEKIRIEQAKALEEAKPKVVFADAVAASHTSILIGELAKLLKQNGCDTGQKRLFQQLRNEGYLMKQGTSKNMPTQKAMEQGLFEVREQTIEKPNGSIVITKTTRVTGKGQVFFINHFLRK